MVLNEKPSELFPRKAFSNSSNEQREREQQIHDDEAINYEHLVHLLEEEEVYMAKVIRSVLERLVRVESGDLGERVSLSVVANAVEIGLTVEGLIADSVLHCVALLSFTVLVV